MASEVLRFCGSEVGSQPGRLRVERVLGVQIWTYVAVQAGAHIWLDTHGRTLECALAYTIVY